MHLPGDSGSRQVQDQYSPSYDSTLPFPADILSPESFSLVRTHCFTWTPRATFDWHLPLGCFSPRSSPTCHQPLKTHVPGHITAMAPMAFPRVGLWEALSLTHACLTETLCSLAPVSLFSLMHACLTAALCSPAPVSLLGRCCVSAPQSHIVTGHNLFLLSPRTSSGHH